MRRGIFWPWLLFFSVVCSCVTAMSDSRERMLAEISGGGGGGAGAGSCASQSSSVATGSLLLRGCDPRMAARALPMLVATLGEGVKIVTTTDDDTFFKHLRESSWSAIMFAPGACRFSAAGQPIPGQGEDTSGWGLDQYKKLIREQQGEGVKILETTEERNIIPILLEAFDPKA